MLQRAHQTHWEWTTAQHVVKLEPVTRCHWKRYHWVRQRWGLKSATQTYFTSQVAISGLVTCFQLACTDVRLDLKDSSCSSSIITLTRPPTSSSLRITNCFIRYALPRLWNQLPASLHQAHSSLNLWFTDPTPITSSSSVDSQLTPSVTLPLFHS